MLYQLSYTPKTSGLRLVSNPRRCKSEVCQISVQIAMVGPLVEALPTAARPPRCWRGFEALGHPFDQVIDEGTGYWPAHPESRRNVPKIRIFRDWIVAEAAKVPAV